MEPDLPAEPMNATLRVFVPAQRKTAVSTSPYRESLPGNEQNLQIVEDASFFISVIEEDDLQNTERELIN